MATALKVQDSPHGKTGDWRAEDYSSDNAACARNYLYFIEVIKAT